MVETRLTVVDGGMRDRLAAFVARVVQLDQAATVRLVRSESPDGTSLVTAWASTPFEVLATRTVPGELAPADAAVSATALLTALAVDRADTVDPGSAAHWRGELPAEHAWTSVGERPSGHLAELVERGLESARADGGAHGPSATLLDEAVLTLSAPAGPPVRVPLRCLFAMSGLGLLDDDAEPIRVSSTRSWLRLDAPLAAIVRRRLVSLPLLL